MVQVFVLVRDDNGEDLATMMVYGDLEEIELMISVANRHSSFRTYTIASTLEN